MTDVTPTSTPPADAGGASVAGCGAPVDRARNPRGQGDRLRDELIRAAVRLLSTAPHPDDVSIRGIARAAGVSPTAAYRHFHDRDELVQAACGACFGDFAAEMLERTSAMTDPFARLREAGNAYLDFANEERGIYRMLFSNPIPMDSDLVMEDSAGKAAFTQLVDIVADCVAAGAPTRTDDAEFLSYQVWTWVHGIVDLRITHTHMQWPPADELLDGVLVSLGLVPPTA